MTCRDCDCKSETFHYNESVNPYIPNRYEVLEFYRDTPDTFTLKIAMPIEHDPGQFVQVTIPGVGEAPISLASAAKDHITLTIHEIGKVTQSLAKLKKAN